MTWHSASALALAAVGSLAGCASLSEATADRTDLKGDVPASLGRVLEVEVEGADPETAADLFAALRRELEAQDLFDRVDRAGGDRVERPLGSTATLQATLLEHSDRELYDVWELDDAYVVRYELDVLLRDGRGQTVLQGRVSGIGADAVTDTEQLDRERREDVRLAALYDAALKLSRALRRTADARFHAALEELAPVGLPPGVGPVTLALLGVDDPETSSRRRGPAVEDALGRAVERLAPDLALSDPEQVSRALEQVAAVRAYDLAPHQVEVVATQLAARYFVVSRVRATGSRVVIEARLLDREGVIVAEPQVASEGLGALRVAAADLARALAEIVAARAEPPGE